MLARDVLRTRNRRLLALAGLAVGAVGAAGGTARRATPVTVIGWAATAASSLLVAKLTMELATPTALPSSAAAASSPPPAPRTDQSWLPLIERLEGRLLAALDDALGLADRVTRLERAAAVDPEA